MPDMGATIKIDERCGDIVEDRDGNLVEVDGVDLFKQLLYTLLQTQEGEDMVYYDYGVDWHSLMTNPFHLEPKSYAQRLVLGAFSTDMQLGLSQVPSVIVEWANDEKTEINVIINAKSVNDEIVSISQGVII